MTDRQENFFNIDAMEQGIRRTLSEGMETRAFFGDSAMISIVRVGPNQSGKLHSHRKNNGASCFVDQVFASRTARRFRLAQEIFWRTPGNVEHGFRAGPEGAVVFDVFAPPREDYKKPGSGFGN